MDSLTIMVVWLGLSITCAILANRKGRSGFGWFMFGLLLSPLFGLIFVACMKPKVTKVKVVSKVHEGRYP